MGIRGEIHPHFPHPRSESLDRLANPVLVSAIAFASMWTSSQFSEPPSIWWPVYVVLLLQALVISELIRAISRRLDRRWPWRASAGRRFFAQVVVALVTTVGYVLLLYVPMKLWRIHNGEDDTIAWQHLAGASVIGLTFAVSLSALYMVSGFYRSWQRTRSEVEKLGELRLRAELETLKMQINPHFLFNSLSTLHSMIATDPNNARAFVIELSEIFRYALSHGDRDIVPLSSELRFLDAFEALLVARHGDVLTIKRILKGDEDGVGLPPMTLQLLVENAVKHNRIGPSEPLTIVISRNDLSLEVSNRSNPKLTDMPGTGNGLKNIDARCRMLAHRGIEIVRKNGDFTVIVPLLPCAQ